MHQKLTIQNIERIEPGVRDVIVYDTVLPGLSIKVTPAGKRGYYLYYRTSAHVQRRPKLGDFPQLKPEKARSIAQQWLAEVSKGKDPSADRMASRHKDRSSNFPTLVATYVEQKKAAGARRTSEIKRIFEHDILPVFGNMRVEDLQPRQLTQLLDTIEKRSPSVALAAYRQLSAFFKWAMTRVPDLSDNPMLKTGRPRPIRSRERVLSMAELRRLWAVLEEEREPWRTAVRLMMLTGQRRDEVLSACWSEFDWQTSAWTIPASRSKNGKEHIVPLTARSAQMVKSLPQKGERVFATGTGPVSRAAKRIRDAVGSDQEWRWHDLRRTMATGLQRLGVRLEVTEAVLNHVSGSRAGIVGVYQRHDWAEEKRDALTLWDAELFKISGGK